MDIDAVYSEFAQEQDEVEENEKWFEVIDYNNYL